MAGMGAMEGHTLSKSLEEFKGKFWEFMLVRSSQTLWDGVRDRGYIHPGYSGCFGSIHAL